ncbi:DUF2812 domain-containing protein [Neobacillus fumarioli]|uniref:DUF2812 domain-containing protein n=1 Tax=Neobacillus fumarioli TaxID=105229 RepID=UPI0014703C6D
MTFIPRILLKKSPKGDYIYRLELLKHPLKHPDSKDYISFMEEMGAELVATYHRWVYFRKKLLRVNSLYTLILNPN